MKYQLILLCASVSAAWNVQATSEVQRAGGAAQFDRSVERLKEQEEVRSRGFLRVGVKEVVLPFRVVVRDDNATLGIIFNLRQTALTHPDYAHPCMKLIIEALSSRRIGENAPRAGRSFWCCEPTRVHEVTPCKVVGFIPLQEYSYLYGLQAMVDIGKSNRSLYPLCREFFIDQRDRVLTSRYFEQIMGERSARSAWSASVYENAMEGLRDAVTQRCRELDAFWISGSCAECGRALADGEVLLSHELAASRPRWTERLSGSLEGEDNDL